MNLKDKILWRDTLISGIGWFSIGALFAQRYDYLIVLILVVISKILNYQIQKR